MKNSVESIAHKLYEMHRNAVMREKLSLECESTHNISVLDFMLNRAVNKAIGNFYSVLLWKM